MRRSLSLLAALSITAAAFAQTDFRFPKKATPPPAAATPQTPPPPVTPPQATPPPAPAAPAVQTPPAPQPAPLSLPATLEEKTVVVYGNRIRYWDVGSGSPVVLIHGMAASKNAWRGNVAALAQKHRVLALDQIGFGDSDKPLVDYRVGTLADFLDGFLRAVRVEQPMLVGSSLGGWVALTYTLAHPDAVSRLVLVDSAGLRAPGRMDDTLHLQLSGATRADLKASLQRVFVNPMFYSDAAVEALYARRMSSGDGYTVARLIESLDRVDESVDDRLSEIKVPALIIWGDHDGLLPLAWGERFAHAISGAKLVVISQSGHMPMIEKAAEFNQTVESWLASE